MSSLERLSRIGPSVLLIVSLNDDISNTTDPDQKRHLIYDLAAVYNLCEIDSNNALWIQNTIQKSIKVLGIMATMTILSKELEQRREDLPYRISMIVANNEFKTLLTENIQERVNGSILSLN